MNYRISFTNPASRYITVEAITENNPKENLHFQLPAWRPGRYELGNFAKNVRNFRVSGDDERELKIEKITKDCWKIEKNNSANVSIKYEYYSADLNAGSTYLDDTQLYINPVNCCGYIVGRISEP